MWSMCFGIMCSSPPWYGIIAYVYWRKTKGAANIAGVLTEGEYVRLLVITMPNKERHS